MVPVEEHLPSCQDIPRHDVTLGDPAVTPTFKWKVSGSRIMSGESDPAMTVGPLAQGGKVEATVEIGGYESFFPCPMTASCTTHIVPVPLPRKFGEYGNIKLKDEWARLDKFAAELRSDPTAQGFFVCYGGRRGTAGEAYNVASGIGHRLRDCFDMLATIVGVSAVPVAGRTCQPSVALPPQAATHSPAKRPSTAVAGIEARGPSRFTPASTKRRRPPRPRSSSRSE